MKPAEICNTVLRAEGVQRALDVLSSPQLKAVLKEGGIKVKLPGGYASQKKKRALWTSRLASAIADGNDSAAGELLQQWLLNHQRQLLIDYLDLLQVKHRAGETDESFLLATPPERAREAAATLLDRHEAQPLVLAYLAYIAHQQRSTVFDGWEPLERRVAGEDPPPAD